MSLERLSKMYKVTCKIVVENVKSMKGHFTMYGELVKK